MHAQDDAYWEWSVFWRSDQLQSCTCEAGDPTADSTAAVWRTFFEALPARARILDLGTGNGILATHAAGVSRSRKGTFEIHGVDVADIDPARFVPSAEKLLADVVFHARTSMETLPFAAGDFDAVVSQYAIEYSDTTRSIPEAMRVLRPGGQFRFLVHADNGVLKARCALQKRQAETILDSGLFPTLDEMLRNIVTAERSRAQRDNVCAQQSITTLGALVAELEAGFSIDADRSLVESLFAAVRSLPELRKTNSLDTLLGAADNVRSLLVAQHRRLDAMQQAALSEKQSEAFVRKLVESSGVDIRLESATSGESEYCVGFWISGNKLPHGGTAVS